MADCEKLPKCPFFHGKMAHMPSMSDIYKARYCQGDNTDCARYAVFKTLGTVPEDLFPNDQERAQSLIAAAS